MDNGWVTIHRKLVESDLWLAEPFTKGQAWADLIISANHTDGFFWVRGNRVVVKRGQIGWSELTMAARWKWSKNKVRRFLKWLETEQQIVQQKSSITTIISLINYDRYQSKEKTKQQTIQQKDSRRNTNNNVNNENKMNIGEADASHPLDEGLTTNPTNMREYREDRHADEFEPSIDADTGESLAPTPKKKVAAHVMAQYREIIAWAEKRRGAPFPQKGYMKQLGALAEARASGIDPDRLTTRWIEMEGDEYWQKQGFDWMNVIRSFDKKP